MKKKTIASLVSISFIALAILGCGKALQEKDRVVATINNEPLYVKDFNRALAFNLKRDPQFKVTPETLEEQIDLIIDRRLLIQEAKKKKLDEVDRFINTIKTFWEQTLIRDLILLKDKEFEPRVSASENEMHDYYNKLSYQMSFNILRTKDRDLVERLLNQDANSIQWEEDVGPFDYESALSLSPITAIAFDIPKGEKRVIQHGNWYYLVYAKDKKSAPVAPFDEMKKEIEEKIKNFKKRRLFDSWLAEARKNADVKINRKVLSEAPLGRN